MKLSHIIFYVKDVLKGVSFYKAALGIEAGFVHESGQYAELETGGVKLAFASDELGKGNLPGGFIANEAKGLPQAAEVTFTVKDVKEAYEKAVREGAIEVVKPDAKPWGQVVGYVRDPNGVLIEIASEM